MDKIKKSMFGGYNKAEVDAKFWDLEKRAERAEAEFAKASENCENLLQTAEQLRQELSVQEARNAELQANLEEIKANPPADSSVIGKVYLHAYETGAEIAGTAKDQVNDLLTDLNNVFDTNQYELKNATNGLVSVGQEISALIDQMNQKTNTLQEILSSFIEKASNIPNAYTGVAQIKDATDRQINDAIGKYEKSAQPFLELLPDAEQPIGKPEEQNDPSFKVIVPPEDDAADDQPVVPTTEVPEETTEPETAGDITDFLVEAPQEPVAEPAAEPTTEPVTEPVTEPKAEQPADLPESDVVRQAMSALEQAAAIFDMPLPPKKDLRVIDPKNPEK